MATAKLILDTKKARKDGTFPIKLAISHKSKTSHILANLSIPKTYWDNGRIKKTCPGIDNIRVANKLAAILLDADDFIDELIKRRRIDLRFIIEIVSNL